MINLLFSLFIFAIILFLLPLHPQKAKYDVWLCLGKGKTLCVWHVQTLLNA